MSDASPVEVGGKPARNPKQIAMVAVLGLVLVALLVIQLPKLLGGGGDSAPETPAAPVAAAPGVAPTPRAPAAPVEVTPPPERPRRSPFDAPR